MEKINDVMREMVNRDGYAAGASTLVIKDGREIFYGETGFIDIQGQVPVRRDSIFRLYSMTKPITAAAVMATVEDGLLDINRSVGSYIPSFLNQTYMDGDKEKPVKRDMKIKDLLNMTSGLSYDGNDSLTARKTTEIFEEGKKRLDSDNEMTTMEFAERIGSIPLQFSPGEKFAYSVSADILGAVIEKVTGKRFGDYLKERLFDPLSMQDTGFYIDDPEKRKRLSKVYEQTPWTLKEYNNNHLNINLKFEHRPGFESGGAGLCSTLDDYSHFAAMLLNKGKYEGKTILKPGTVKYLTEGDIEEGGPKESLKNWDGMDGFAYSNLMRVLKEPGKAVVFGSKGEYGWDGWLGPYFINDPAHNLTILHMLQRTNTGTTTYMRRIRNIVFAEMED